MTWLNMFFTKQANDSDIVDDRYVLNADKDLSVQVMDDPGETTVYAVMDETYDPFEPLETFDTLEKAMRNVVEEQW
tara:strand:+ start:2105 stop:2332 length:228 start_codon:yes stop_codon:yes gene_type:complete